VRAKVVKNKIAPPFRLTEFDILFSQGISREGDLIDLAAHSGVISKQGAWYSHGKTRLGQGRERVRTFLLENPDLVEALTQEVKLALGLQPPASERGATVAEPPPEARAT
jgi:recombination protein RecA